MVDRREAVALLPELRNALDERLRVRVLRIAEHGLGSAFLDNLSTEHHGHAIGDTANDAEIVRDQNDRHMQPLLEFPKLVDDLRLDRHVERGRGFVGDEDVGLAGERHCDHRTLLHAAAELVRIIVHALRRIHDADEFEHLHDLGVDILHIGAVQLDRLRDLRATGEDGSERRAWFLENVGDAVTADIAQLARRFFQHVLAIEQDLPGAIDSGRLGQQSRKREAGYALAAAAFADDRERLPGCELKGNAPHRLDGAGFRGEVDGEIANVEERSVGHRNEWF